MRILVLNYEFPPVGGGGGRIAQELCKGLAKRGHEIRVQTSHLKGLPKKERMDGYQIFRSFSFRKKADTCSVFEMFLYVLCNFIPTLLQIKKFKPEIIHAHFAVPTGLLALLVSWLSGVPYIITAHLGDVPGGVPEQTDKLFSKLNRFIQIIWNQASGRTAVSKYVADLANKAYGLPIKVIFNGFDFSEVILSNIPAKKPLRLLLVGRFNVQKNIPFMVEVLSGIRDLEWEASFIGEGPEFEKIKNEIEKQELSEKIHLHGWLEPAQIKLYLQNSDILLLPSLHEGLPMVGVEALGYGLCLVGSDIGGLKDIIIPQKNGFLCPVSHQEFFEKALRTLFQLENGLLAAMKNESLLLSRKFDLENILDAYEEEFDSVVTSRLAYQV